MKKHIIAIVAIVSLLIIGGVVATSGSGESNQSSTAQESKKPTSPTPASTNDTENNSRSSSAAMSGVPTEQTFSSSQVAEHSTESDCWTVIDRKVYNLTSYISQHPGGSEILRACGRDGTKLFDTQGGRGKHSSQADAELKKLLLGSLKN